MEEGKTVVDHLRELRQRRGLTVDRLADRRSLLDALGTTDPTKALNRLVERIDQLRPDDNVRALKYAYGLEGNSSTLKARRDEFNATFKKGYSHDTFEAWEDKAIQELASYVATRQVLDLPDMFDLWVQQTIRNRRLVKFSVYAVWNDDYVMAKDMHYENSRCLYYKYSEEGWMMLPALIYQLREGFGRKVGYLWLRASFYGSEEDMPKQGWIMSGESYIRAVVNDYDEPGELQAFEYSNPEMSREFLTAFANPFPGMVAVLAWEY